MKKNDAEVKNGIFLKGIESQIEEEIMERLQIIDIGITTPPVPNKTDYRTGLIRFYQRYGFNYHLNCYRSEKKSDGKDK